MYGIQKFIDDNFAPYTNPSIGAIKPALNKLEDLRFIRSRKTLSNGGKQLGFYSLTEAGKDALVNFLIEPISHNPIQFLSVARVRLSCCAILEPENKKQLYFMIKQRAMEHKLSAENILAKDSGVSFYQRAVLDNAVCEYTNIINLTENLEKIG